MDTTSLAAVKALIANQGTMASLGLSYDNTGVGSLNTGSPNTFHDACKKFKLGDILRQSLKTDLRCVAPAADAAQLATMWQIGLDVRAPASVILRAYGRTVTSTGTPGELAIQAYGASPSDQQIAVAPNGDIVVLAASLYTSADVEYLPCRGDVVSLPKCKVASNSFTIPTKYSGKVVYLLDANASVATSTGRKIILTPSASSVSAGQARLNVAKTAIAFYSSDAVTEADITLFVASEFDLDAFLRNESNLG